MAAVDLFIGGDRECAWCHERKSLAHFSRGHYECRECRRLAYAENRGGVADKNRARTRRMAEENPEGKRAADLAYRKANASEIAERGRDYRSRNADRLSEKYAERYRCNRIRILLKSAKRRAATKGIAFDITEHDIVVPATCPVLGIPLVWREERRKRGFPQDQTPSIDRVDNSKGYTRDNIRVISWRANSIKSDATLAEIEALADYMRGGGNK